ncbi:unnamed protein product [Microthlaspi erraticum]|uniref:F-box domain-containing protein n=1 Tax=Microthlaspi erraticum TaxID=1685480 RepID=A0A6D2I754_9BRAS|nr:unnamed protein product [Microthlaspi erraticum]
MAEKEQSSEPPPSLPEDVILDILARVPRCNYPTLSLVSKHFRSLVASREIYARRSLLGCTENCVYVILCNRNNCDDGQLYILSREANGNQGLFLIPSLPSMPQFAQPLPSMPVLMAVTKADIIDGRIYVIGYFGISTRRVGDACVVDDVLYYYDNVENKLRAYDSEKKCWGVVNGVEELLAKKRVYGWWKTVSYGGKLFCSIVKENSLE